MRYLQASLLGPSCRLNGHNQYCWCEYPSQLQHCPNTAPLQTNTTLEVLELNGNVIDYEGIGAIAEALTQNTSLKTLGLRWAR